MTNTPSADYPLTTLRTTVPAVGKAIPTDRRKAIQGAPHRGRHIAWALAAVRRRRRRCVPVLVRVLSPGHRLGCARAVECAAASVRAWHGRRTGPVECRLQGRRGAGRA